MRWFIVLSLVSVVFADTRLDSQWEQFKVDFERVYETPEEELARKQVFVKNLGYYEAHNKLFADGSVSHDLGINQFSDWTPEEYHGYLNLQTVNISTLPAEFIAPEIAIPFDVPATFDWRSSGKVTPIKNQGSCGSCWAFASVAAVEALELVKSSKTTSLSEQELVDCEKSDKGCNGGTATGAFGYIRSTGLETESDYPYKGKTGTCAASTAKTHLKIGGYKAISGASDATIKASLQANGPHTVQIDASGNDFSAYKSGIISSGGKNINHMVLLVGWGSNYWIIKNSWGTSWGQSGYGYIATGNNVRGINSGPYYPTL